MSEANPNPAITSLTAKAGDKVDNYTIMEQVGAGGTAIVFRGHDHVLNRNVAIKQIVVPQGEEGEDIRQRALAEAQIHKRIAATDPNLLVQYIDTINDPRGIFLISEYVDGPSLEWMIQQETQPKEQRQALGIIAATAKALDALHQGGVVHRDLKPSNILMPRAGGLKLADFGLATIVAEQQTLDLGSVRYMAPELLQGEPATPKSDLYSLGIVAYELLAGRENFNTAFRTILRDQRNQSMRWVKWHTNVRAKVTSLDQLVDGIPPSLSQLVARMMEKDPARRVGSCAELLDAIRTHFSQDGQAAQTAPGPHAAMAPPKIDEASQTAVVPQKSKLPIILAATLIVWLLAIGGFVLWKKQQTEEALAQQKTALITDIEAADDLINELQYEQAIAAFDAIPTDHAHLFDPDNRRGRDNLVESGSLKAQALLAFQNDDYVTAHQKALSYLNTISASETPNIATSLDKRDAQNMVDKYVKRAAFQQICIDINKLLDEAKFDQATIAIRQLKTETAANSTQEDLDQIETLELRQKHLINDQRIVRLIAQASELVEAGEMQDAIDTLETEIQDAGEDADKRVTDLAGQLNKQLQIKEFAAALAEAEQVGDPADILAAMKTLQGVQPTQTRKARINELEIRMMITSAETALLEGQPELAESLLEEIIKRDPQSDQAKRMIGSLEDARKMIEVVKQADQLLADSKYQQAIDTYKRALDFGPDTSGSINAKIQDATGRIHLAETEKALEARDVATAQDRLDKAKAAHGETDTIEDLQARIDELREYTLLVDEGNALFRNDDFGRAKVKYLAARKIVENNAINQKIRDCDFGIWLSQCDRSMLQRDWPAAESALKRAEEIKVNDQTRARRAQIEGRDK